MTILPIGDIHFPYHNKKALNKIYKVVKEKQPDYIIQMGDLIDQYYFSKYTKNVDFTTPEKELARARKDAELFWSTIQKLSPKSKCYQLKGNHDERLIKRVQEKLPEITSLMKKVIDDLYAFPNVTTMPSERDELIIDGLMFIHGHLSQLGDHSKKNLMNVVVGHSHTGGVRFFKHKNKILWELNAGYLADENALPLQYGLQKMKTWTLGYGLLTKADGIWQPQFIPLQ